jgi:signal transduction histidine kinase
MGQYKEALDWLHRALHSSANEKFYKNYGALYSNMASTFNSLGISDSAEYYINIAIKDARENDNLLFLATALSMQAKIFIDNEKPHLAEAPLHEAVAIRKQLNDPFYIVYDMSSLASYYASNNQPEKGIALCNEGIAIAKEKGLTSQLLMIYQALAENYKAAGKSAEYSETLENIIRLKDSFNNINSSKLIAEMQATNEAQKQEKKILEQQLVLTRKNYWLYGSAIFAIMLATMGWLAFRNYRRRQQLKMQVALNEEKRMAAEAVKNAEEKERVRIASDLHDNLGTYAASMASNLSYIQVPEGDEKTTMAFGELRNNSTAIISQLNDTIWVLKKDALSLTAISDRIKNFVNRIQRSYPDIHIEVEEQIETDHQLPSSQAFHLYRVLQEAINNSLKHSTGKNIVVTITGNGGWKASVRDDGCGMDNTKQSSMGGNGLQNMKARCKEAGWDISWQTKAAGGTTVEIVPTTN